MTGKAVTALTGKEAESYQFGDITKNVIASLTGKDAESYQFGDITKNAVASWTGKDAESYQFGDITKSAVTKFTGKEGYEFGDITRKVISNSEIELAKLKEDYLTTIPTQIWQHFFGHLSAQQRRAVRNSLLQYGAVFMLSYGFVGNLIAGGTIAAAWASASCSTSLSPLATGQWVHFLSAHSTICITLRLFDPFLVPLRTGIAFLLIPLFRDFASALQRYLPMRSRPTYNRALALGVTFLLGNGFLTSLMTALGVWGVSLATGVPMLPR